MDKIQRHHDKSTLIFISLSYIWPQSKQFDDHLDGEERGEDHVQDVHDRIKQIGLLIVLLRQ